MDPASAPSPNGFTEQFFFQLAWDILGMNVCNAIMYFFQDQLFAARFEL